MTQPPEPGRPPQGDGGAHDPTQVAFGKNPQQPTPQPQPPQQPTPQPPQQPYAQPPAPPAAPAPAPAPAGPGTPPHAQPPAGYGYPQTPPMPNPYLQQPGGQPPQYGYPQPATLPAPPPAGQRSEAERKALRAQVAIVVSAVVAIALIIGGGVWYSGSKGDKPGPVAGGGGDGKTGGGTEKVPSDPSARLLFELAQPTVEKGLQVTVEGSWLTKDAYVKSGSSEITGYDPASGAEKWSIPLPGPVCFASRHVTGDGRTAIVHEPAKPTAETPTTGCSEVTALDLATGKKLWTKNAKTGDRPVRFDNVTVSGTTVAAGSSYGGAAWDLTDGGSLWQPKPGDTCNDYGYGGGKALVALRKCTSAAAQMLIQTIDPKEGTVLSEYKMPEGVEYASVVSTDPLVIAADVGRTAGDGSGVSDLFSIDAATGELRAKISAPGDTYAGDCDGVTRVEQCANMAVTQDRLYLPTEEHTTGGADAGRTNEVVAFDLATGKAGRKADAGDGWALAPLRADGDDVISYKRGPYDKGGQIVSIDGTTMKQTVLLQMPNDEKARDVEIEFSPDHQEFLYSAGRLYMSQVYVRDADQADEKLVVAYGTKG
ncbi:outer membrane protein assembly factor BamB family protein [Streptomyces sp. NPDC002644]